jgi:hypothetical protein
MAYAGASTTHNLYTHAMPDRRRDILLTVEEFFPPNAETPVAGD